VANNSENNDNKDNNNNNNNNNNSGVCDKFPCATKLFAKNVTNSIEPAEQVKDVMPADEFVVATLCFQVQLSKSFEMLCWSKMEKISWIDLVLQRVMEDIQ
jgi:hypothetical protein